MASRTTEQTPPWRRALLTIVAVLAMLGLPVAAASPALADVTSSEKSIVQLYIQYTATITTEYQAGPKDSTVELGFSCTGFFVSTKGDIATAGHCVDVNEVTVKDIANKIVAILRGAGNDDIYIKQFLDVTTVKSVVLDGVIAYQPREVGGVLDAQGFQVQVVNSKPIDQGDYALLRLNNFTQPTPPLRISSTAPEIQQHVTAVGFPGVVASTADAGRQRVSYPDGKVISKQTRAGVPWVEVSVDLQHGMSGGPVLNDQDQVVGLVSWGNTSAGDEAKYITELRGLRDFLTANGVVLDAAPAPQATPSSTADGSLGLPAPAASSSGGGGGALVPVLIGVIVVLVGGGAGYVLYSRRQQGKAPAA